MNDKNLKKLWLLSIFIILVLFSAYLIYKDKDEFISSSESKKVPKLVENYNNFYTVNSCVYRYLTYLQNKNTGSLLKVLDEDFIKSNSINENNIYNFLVTYEGNLNFNSRIMYEEKVNDHITKYYVYGYVEIDIMDSFPEQHNAYFIVNLDEENKVFSIQPYSGDIFK